MRMTEKAFDFDSLSDGIFLYTQILYAGTLIFLVFQFLQISIFFPGILICPIFYFRQVYFRRLGAYQVPGKIYQTYKNIQNLLILVFQQQKYSKYEIPYDQPSQRDHF